MTHVTLQRVIVRMLYDPSFRDAVYGDPAQALAGLGLGAREHTWLTRPDPRAYQTDPLRCARSLHALRDEYPRTLAALGPRAGDFFQAPVFHACIQERGTLALAFGAWAAAVLATVDAEAARLELTIATLRRAPPPRAPVPRGPLRLSPRAALLSDGQLVVAAPDGTVSIEAAPPALAALLTAAGEAGATRETLAAITRQHGAEPGEDDQILDELCQGGLLAAR